MYTNTIWITGSEGRLGSALVKELKKDNKVIATDKDVDITDIKALEKFAALYKPSLIINCAGISDPAYCETHRIEAYRVNALGARNMAAVARQQNARIIHFSSDDVFSGENHREKNEFDVPTPKTVYGMSKLAGENLVRELSPRHLVIRSSWVYGIGKDDYFSQVLEHGKKGESFTAEVDRISTPTSIDELLECLKAVIPSSEYGIMHISCAGMCSRYTYARTILSMMGYDPSLVKEAVSEQTRGRVSTMLENLMLKMNGLYEMPEWQAAMRAYIRRKYGISPDGGKN